MSEKLYSTFEVAKMCQVNPASIVRWIHEGKLKAASTAGGHFRIFSGEVARFLKTLGMPIPQVLNELSSPKKILIVDDEADVRKFLRVFIARHFPDVLIQEAEDGFHAGTSLTTFLPDLVLLDLKIPGMDGFRVCEFIRQVPELKQTRIIVITGLEDDNAKEKVLRLGADDFFRKPLDGDALKKKISTYFGLPQETEERSK